MYHYSAAILEQSMEARNRVGRGLSYRAGIFKESMGASNRGGIGLSYVQRSQICHSRVLSGCSHWLFLASLTVF
jgi:hypothetical protein